MIDMLDKVETKTDLSDWIIDDVLVIILLNRNANFKGTLKPYDLDIFGKKMWEWVVMCADDCVIKTTICTDESDVISLVKPLLTNAKYTAVLYSDTPLLTRKTFLEIMDYVRSKDINVLKLTRGYIFNTEYIKSVNSISATQNKYFNEEDFVVAYDYKQLAFISDILKHRILDFHLKNGVFIQDMASVFIDANVVIESGVKILPNNIIKGNTFIQKNAVISFGNYIENSIISTSANILNSTIVASKISANMIIGPYEHIKGKNV